MSEWISVKDRPPENRERVLAFLEGGSQYLAVFREGKVLNGFFVYGIGTGLTLVTHWMPLPEPPEVSEDE
jgi:hypothetical protein